MAEEFKTSFIPKKGTETTRRRRKHALSVFTLAGFVVFFAAVLAAGSMFLYEQLLEQSIESKRQQIIEIRESLEPSLIRELIRLDERLTIGTQLLNNHVAVSSLFEHLEDITLETVRFERFELSIPKSSSGGVDIELGLGGSAIGFSAVALQSDEFAESTYLESPLFSNFVITDTGDVTFAASAVVNKALLKYEANTEALPVPEIEDESEATEEENADGDADVPEEGLDELEDELGNLDEELGELENL